jgi:hypothetical protein
MELIETNVGSAVSAVPSVVINGRRVVVTSKWPRIAQIQDEDWVEGEIAPSPDQFIEILSQDNNLRADIFTFTQKVTDPTPHFPFFYRWDSIAVIPVVSFSDWWTKRISTDIRRSVKAAAKREVVVRNVPFSDDFVRGIVDIYNETPIRQGRPFCHYGKDFATVRKENATYLERSEFLGAFLRDELIGFLKVVYVDRVARLMQIIGKECHRGASPVNALIAKAVELCEMKCCSHLTWCKYYYLQGPDGLSTFKHRNGFEECLIPRYYVPVSAMGRLAMSLQLERGPRAWVPARLLQSLRRVRAFVYRHLPPTP